MAGDFIRFWQIYLCLLCVDFFLKSLKRDSSFQLLYQKIVLHKILEILTALDKYCLFCIDVVGVTKILLIAVLMNSVLQYLFSVFAQH